MTFLEKDLEDALMEKGLIFSEKFEDDIVIIERQYVIGSDRLDLLAESRIYKNRLYVIELKVDEFNDAALTQLFYYMASLKRYCDFNGADFVEVKGIGIGFDVSNRAKTVFADNPDIEFIEYDIDVELNSYMGSANMEYYTESNKSFETISNWVKRRSSDCLDGSNSTEA